MTSFYITFFGRNKAFTILFFNYETVSLLRATALVIFIVYSVQFVLISYVSFLYVPYLFETAEHKTLISFLTTLLYHPTQK